MEIEVIKKLIRETLINHADFCIDAKIGDRYYKGDTDILNKEDIDKETDNPLRNADNRIPTNWHGLLVDQKAAYMLTYPPIFDVGSKAVNKRITEILGDEFSKVCKDLCIEAANKSVAWLHIWKGDNNSFQYAVVPSEQVIPLYSKNLKKSILAVLRVYSSIDENGESFKVYEYWTEKECYAYRQPSGKEIDDLEEFNSFTYINIDTGDEELTNVISHDFEEVPFIPFFNNNIKTSDLKKVKHYIDVYDKVFSGFINDIEDIQEIIFVLTNYGGTTTKDFLKNLKKYKVVDMQSDGADDKTGLETLNINIPIEAREKVLDICEKQIYKQGQGVDPNPEAFGNSSGIALEYLYSLLELKVGLAETEFKLGFSKLIRFICKYIGVSVSIINQTWTRNKIRNELELAELASKSLGVISIETIVKNHPWVEEPDKELAALKSEREDTEPFKDRVPLEELSDEE